MDISLTFSTVAVTAVKTVTEPKVLVIDMLFLRTTKEIVFISPDLSFLLKAVSGFHVFFQIKLETLGLRPH